MSQIEIKITQAEIETAADRAAHIAMGFVMSGYGDISSPTDNHTITGKRLQAYLSCVRKCLDAELTKQEQKARRIERGTQRDRPDAFILDGVKRKKRRTKTA